MSPITVLIPVHNTGRWLRETIGSVQAQTFTNWKLIAIDDGSTDGSGAVLEELARGDSRIKVLVRANRGLVPTRNELLAMADTELIAWLDSDDRMTPDRLALQLGKFTAEPELVCLGGAATLTDPDGLPIKTHGFATGHEELVKAMLEEIAFYFPSVTMRREAAVKVGGFREPLAIAEDYDICLRLSEMGRVGNLAEVILLYRQHMASAANAGRPKTYIFAKVVRALAEERRTLGSDRLQRGETVAINFDHLPSAKKNAAETHARWAWWALEAGNVGTARKYAWRTLRERPLAVGSWRLLGCAVRGY